MATILSFRPSQRSSGAAAHSGARPPAQIVFFPGIRYERWTEEAAKPKKAKRTRRDKIELQD